MHLALGTDYRTVASCKLKFRDIFDKPHGRVHGAADVISTYPIELLLNIIGSSSNKNSSSNSRIDSDYNSLVVVVVITY